MIEYSQDFTGFAEAVTYTDECMDEIEDFSLELVRMEVHFVTTQKEREQLQPEFGDFCSVGSFEYTYVFTSEGTWEFLGYARYNI